MIGGQRIWLLAAFGFAAFITALIVFRPVTPLEPYIQQATHAGKERLGWHDDETSLMEPLPGQAPTGPPSTEIHTSEEAHTALEGPDRQIPDPQMQPQRKLEDDVYNATLGFEKLYVINLPDRTDHKDELTIAGSLLNIHFDFIPGIRGADVPDKALPPPGDQRKKFGNGNVGSWRAHMDAIQGILDKNLSSAVIFEDDIDFDVRLKEQLATFAEGSRALTQPLGTSPSPDQPLYADPTLASRNNDSNATPLPHDLNSTNAPTTLAPSTSPYGDNWDVLWLGHCGALFPKTSQHIPQGRYTTLDDQTVPLWKYNNSGKGYNEKPEGLYPEHSRVVHHARFMICTFAYAVSARGARRILYDLGVSAFHDPFDVALAIWCEKKGTCLTVQPQLISLYRAPGAWNKDSDIHPGAGGDKVRKKGSSPYIRQSVKINMGRLVEGEWEGLEDQYPDDYEGKMKEKEAEKEREKKAKVEAERRKKEKEAKEKAEKEKGKDAAA